MVYCRSSGTIDGVHAMLVSVINTTLHTPTIYTVIPLLPLTYPFRNVSDFTLQDFG